MKKYSNDIIITLLLFIVPAIYYFYTPKSVNVMFDRISQSNAEVLDEERIKLSEDLEVYLAKGLPKDTGKTPTILHLFLGNQRKLLDLIFRDAIAWIKSSAVKKGKIRVWSIMNMGAVVKTNEKTIAFDISDMTLSNVQEDLSGIADIFLVTHGDSDHYDPSLLKKALEQGKVVIFPEDFGFLYDDNESFRIYKLADGESINIDGVKITAFQTDHRGNGSFLEPNAWYLVETGGFKILHTGDGRDFKDRKKSEGLKNSGIDIFLCNRKIHPFNVRDVNPKVVVPLHLYKFIHNREELGQSTFDYVMKDYSQYEKDLRGIKKKYLFPGESFTYPEGN